MNEKLVMDVLRMFKERQKVYNQRWLEDDTDFVANCLSVGYNSAVEMLTAAINGDEEALRQYDYFGEE